MKLNTKIKASHCLSILSVTLLISVPLLNSNNLDNYQSSTTKVFNVKKDGHSNINTNKIKLDNIKSYSNISKLGFFGDTKDQKPNFWFDTVNNTINVDSNRPITKRIQDIKDNMPRITITIENSDNTIKEIKVSPSTHTESGETYIKWVKPAGSDWIEKNLQGSAHNEKYHELKLKTDQSATIVLTYPSFIEDKTNTAIGEFGYIAKTTSNNLSYQSAKSLNLKNTKIVEKQITKQSFVFKTSNSPKNNLRHKKSIISPKTLRSTLLFPTSHNYSSQTVDNSASIRNLDINWTNLWNEKNPATLHNTLKSSSRSANNIFSFNKMASDVNIHINSAYGWIDKNTNSYLLKYSGIVQNGYNLGNLYKDKTYKIKSQPFNHLITMDFNTKGITRTDLNLDYNTIPSYVFNIKKNSDSSIDPYDVVYNKNPQIIGIAAANTNAFNNRLIYHTGSDKFTAWVDQNGLNINTNKTLNDTTAIHKYEIKFSKYDSDYKKINIDSTQSTIKLSQHGNNNHWEMSENNKKQFINVGENHWLIPLSKQMPMIEVEFKYADKSARQKNKTRAQDFFKYLKNSPTTMTSTIEDPVNELQMAIHSDITTKTKTTKVIVYRGADGMNHLLWDTSKQIKSLNNKTISNSQYSISTYQLANQIKKAFESGKSMAEINSEIKTDPKYGQTIDVVGHNAPNIEITSESTATGIEFNVKTFNLDANQTVNTSKNPVVYQEVLINGANSTEFFIDQYGNTSITVQNNIFPTWAIAVIVIFLLLIICLTVFVFIKLRRY